MSLVDDLLQAPILARRQVMSKLGEDDLKIVLRRSLADHGTTYILWRDDPVGFVHQVIGGHTTGDQRLVLESVRDRQRTVAVAAHAVGKSFSAARVVAWWIATSPPGEARAISTAPGDRQVRRVLWPYIHRAHGTAGLPGRLNQVEWVLRLGEVDFISAFGFSPGAQAEASVQGFHAKRLLIVVDEGGGIPLVLGRNFESIMTGGAHILVIGNPPTDDEGTWFETIASNDLWNPIHIGAFDSPNFCPNPSCHDDLGIRTAVYEPGAPCLVCGTSTEYCPPDIAAELVDDIWVRNIVRQYGTDDPYYKARVLAVFPKSSSRRAVPRAWVEKCVIEPDDEIGDDSAEARMLQSPQAAWQRLGVDVAAGGGDEMVVALADGPFLSVQQAWSGGEASNQVVNAERVYDHVRVAEARQADLGYTERAVRVKIDWLGVGGATADLLDSWRCPCGATNDAGCTMPGVVSGPLGASGPQPAHHADVVAVNVAESPSDPVKFYRRRDEAWWAMRELCRDSAVRLLITEREVEQLSSPSFTDHQYGGRIKVEAKDDMKRRGRTSPDRADALNLAVYEPGPVGPAVSHADELVAAGALPSRPGEIRPLSSWAGGGGPEGY